MMKAYLLKLECLTNLHVGSGEANFEVVDNTVEKDPLLQEAVIHSTGVKGAMRAFAEEQINEKSIIKYVFGEPGDDSSNGTEKAASAGKLKFLDAQLLYRPLRVCGDSQHAFIPVARKDMIDRFLQLTKAFGCKPTECIIDQLPSSINFGQTDFLCSVQGAKVEAEPTGSLTLNNAQVTDTLKYLMGDAYALASSFDNFPLPIIARNCLDAKNPNLWYEEYVPHHSVFYTIVLNPYENDKKVNEVLETIAPKNGAIIQFGGNASVGYGFVKVSRWEECGEEQQHE